MQAFYIHNANAIVFANNGFKKKEIEKNNLHRKDSFFSEL